MNKAQILAAYDQGFQEGERKAKFALADKPYMMLWCPCCNCESASERESIDSAMGGVTVLVPPCAKCGARLLSGSVSGRELMELRLGTRPQPEYASPKQENREESMSKAYFERAESDKRHRVTIRLIEVGPCSAQVEVTTNATSGELGSNGNYPQHVHYTMQLGTPEQGFTVVVED